MKNLRLYTFVNWYINSIGQGIQTAHVVHELFNKYHSDSSFQHTLKDWSKNHKTIIVLNGGANKDILEKYLFMSRELHNVESSIDMPYTCFNEDNDSLGGIMTAVGLVVPEDIYDAQRTNLSDSYFYTDNHGNTVKYELESVTGRFISLLKSCPLAR